MFSTCGGSGVKTLPESEPPRVEFTSDYRTAGV